VSAYQDPIIVPHNEYDPVLEDKVKYYLTLTPDLPKNDKRIIRAKAPEGATPYELEIWQREEVRRIREGHFGMSPKMYFFYNYVKMWDIESGLIRPEYRVCQQAWFSLIEECQASREWGVICVKRRRVGASWLEASDVMHDCIINPMFKVGMTSKTEADAIELFKKVKFVYDNLPDWLRPTSSAGNTRSSIDFSYFIKDSTGSRRRLGLQSEIIVKAPTDTSWEGFALRKLVIDECFGRGTLVRMFNGNIKPIEDIKIGDKVIGLKGKPRTVECTTSGISDLYRITPNKGEPFVCNGAHLLTVTFNGTSKVLNIKTSEFFKLKKKRIRGYQLMRSGWEYKRKPLSIDPYWLGCWLGDGSSSSPSICAADPELKEYLEKEAPSVLNCKVTPNKRADGIVTYYYGNNYSRDHGGIRNRLKRIKVYNNKHIPLRYLKSNRLDRLRLLAGIIDTDGHKAKNKEQYEVTFKIKRLSEELKELCISLGFYASLNKKIATMKREDGSIYKCEVYRVHIYGSNLSDIPCKVKRKQSNGSPKVKGRKTPEKTGFKIEKIEDGEYFGIRLKEDPYFLLHDGTIVHNCGKISNLKSMFSMANEVMRVGHRRSGIPLLFGTAGEVSKEGKDLKEMWYNAEIYKLKQFFYGGWNGIIVDQFGNDLKEEAIRWIVYERKRREGLSQKEYNDFLQQYPLTVQEAFTSNENQGLGNQVKISKQLQSLYENPVKEKKGYFKLDKDENVVFHPDNRGACIIYEDPDPSLKNTYCASADPTDHEVTDTSGLSSLSMFIMKKSNGIQPPKIVFQYTDRPNIPRDFYEQALMALLYYNKCKILIERNKSGMITYFDERGYKYLLQTTPQGMTRLIGGNTFNIGYYRTKASKQYGEELVCEYIEDYCEYIPCKELLKELQSYGVINTDRVDALQAGLMFLREDKTKSIASSLVKEKTPNFGLSRIGGRLVRNKHDSNGQKIYHI